MLPVLLAMSQVLYAEPLRPQFHFTAKTGWLNDPNGLVYKDGEYHLFFQHNPKGTEWGNMTWGHAISRDLVHWRQLDNAIEPDNRGTIYSGSAVTDPLNTSGLNADIIALYTAAGGKNPESNGQPFTQCLAYSQDNGRTFKKLDTPILGHIVAENRDPKVDWHAPTKSWIMALYLDAEQFALFTSKDLKSWREIQRFSMPGANECPDFFEIPIQGSKEKRWVFTGANGRYWVGSFDGEVFKPDGEPRQVEFGGNNYAVQTYYGLPDQRRVQIGWMNGGRYPGMPFNQQMTFPCELTLRKASDGLRLFRYPVREIEKLWIKSEEVVSQPLKGQVSADLGSSELLDIDAEITPGRGFTMSVHGVGISYDAITQTLSCLGRTAYVPSPKGVHQLRILVDRTSFEIFANDGLVSMSTCRLPTALKGLTCEYGPGGSAKLTVRTLRSAW